MVLIIFCFHSSDWDKPIDGAQHSACENVRLITSFYTIYGASRKHFFFCAELTHPPHIAAPLSYLIFFNNFWLISASGAQVRCRRPGARTQRWVWGALSFGARLHRIIHIYTVNGVYWAAHIVKGCLFCVCFFYLFVSCGRYVYGWCLGLKYCKHIRPRRAFPKRTHTYTHTQNMQTLRAPCRPFDVCT